MTTRINLAPPSVRWISRRSPTAAERAYGLTLEGAARTALGRAAALREAFRRVRRAVWAEREMRLRATWEGYG